MIEYVGSGVPKRYASGGVDISGGINVTPRQFILVAGSGAAAQCAIKAEGSSGTEVLDLAAPASDMKVVQCVIDTPYLASLSGAGAVLIVIQ